MDRSPGTVIVNEYGPTETVVGCCVYEVGPGDVARGVVPIIRIDERDHRSRIDEDHR